MSVSSLGGPFRVIILFCVSFQNNEMKSKAGGKRVSYTLLVGAIFLEAAYYRLPSIFNEYKVVQPMALPAGIYSKETIQGMCREHTTGYGEGVKAVWRWTRRVTLRTYAVAY